MHKFVFGAFMLFGCAAAQAESALEGNVLRFEAFYGNHGEALSTGDNEVSALMSEFGVIGTFQSELGLYGQLGLSRVSIEEVEINGRTFDSSQRYSGRALGVGYRMDRQRPELFWGFGYEHAKADENIADDVHSVRVFWEKENFRRYGAISLAYNFSENAKFVTVSGRHIWLAQNGFGGGLFWKLGSGSSDAISRIGESSADMGLVSLGAIIMYRPRF